MRCHICDKALSESEIIPTLGRHSFEPCTTCLDIALDAAYSDGFVREDPLDDPELQEEFGNGAVEILEDSDFGYGDAGDIILVDEFDEGEWEDCYDD